jgi:hypothetical protein
VLIVFDQKYLLGAGCVAALVSQPYRTVPYRTVLYCTVDPPPCNGVLHPGPCAVHDQNDLGLRHAHARRGRRDGGRRRPREDFGWQQEETLKRQYTPGWEETLSNADIGGGCFGGCSIITMHFALVSLLFTASLWRLSLALACMPPWMARRHGTALRIGIPYVSL